MTNARVLLFVGWMAVLALAACEPRASCGQDAAAGDDASVAPDAAPGDDATIGDAAIDDAGAPIPLVVADRTGIDFGTGCIGWPATRATVQLANAGTSRVDVSASVTGTDADLFALDTSTCTGGLAGGSFCAVAVDTALTALSALGPRSAELVVDAGGAHFTLPITLTAATCDAAPLEPAAYDFGAIAVGARSAPRTFSILNAGGGLFGPFTNARSSGSDASAFEIVRDGCTGHAIVSGARCEIDVVFAPTRVGNASSSLVLDGVVSSASALTGTGT